ncbi:MAG: CobW family GTP-binding protein [Alphaproteobacteria bacterium]
MDRPRARKPAIPLTLVTGPKGAGKTTLINRLLASETYRNTAVILNEFGRTALAEAPAEAVDDSIVALGSGCVCCTVRGELVTALERLLRGLDNGRIDQLDRLIIETDGAADPAAVLAGVVRHPYLQLRYRPAGIIALMAKAGISGAHQVTLSQIAMADAVVLVGDGAAGDLDALTRINPWAVRVPLEDVSAGDLTELAFWTGDMAAPAAALAHLAQPRDRAADEGAAGEFVAFAVHRDRAFRPAALQGFIDHVAHILGPALVRVFGVVEAADTRTVVRALGGMFLPSTVIERAGRGALATRFHVTLRGSPADAFIDCLDGFLGEVRIDTPDGDALGDNPLAVAGFSARPAHRR